MTATVIELPDHTGHLGDQTDSVDLHHLLVTVLPCPAWPPARLAVPGHVAPAVEAAATQDLQAGCVVTAVVSVTEHNTFRHSSTCSVFTLSEWPTTTGLAQSAVRLNSLSVQLKSKWEFDWPPVWNWYGGDGGWHATSIENWPAGKSNCVGHFPPNLVHWLVTHFLSKISPEGIRNLPGSQSPSFSSPTWWPPVILRMFSSEHLNSWASTSRLRERRH